MTGMGVVGRMKALSLAGRIILENGGETYRAENTVLYMAKALKLSEVDVFGVPSGLFISFTNESGERETNVCRIHSRGTHLGRVDAVNQISRRLTEGGLTAEELLEALRRAEAMGEKVPVLYAPAWAALSSLAFAVMFGGGPVDMLVGAFCAGLTQLMPRLFSGRASGTMIATLMGSVLCTLLPHWLHALTGLGVLDVMIASALMPLVPGLSMTIAMQDILRGDMVSGVANAARAVMIAALMAGGTLIGLYICGLLTDLMPVTPGARMAYSPALGAAVMFLSSFFAGGSFGALLYAPRKGMLWGGLIGGIGYLCYWLILRFGQTEPVAMLCSALLTAVLAQLAARRLRMIATVFLTIAMLPLIPGLGLYRSMSELAQAQVNAGLTTAANTMCLFLLMVMGIALGTALTEKRRVPRRDARENGRAVRPR